TQALLDPDLRQGGRDRGPDLHGVRRAPRKVGVTLVSATWVLIVTVYAVGGLAGGVFSAWGRKRGRGCCTGLTGPTTSSSLLTRLPHAPAAWGGAMARSVSKEGQSV